MGSFRPRLARRECDRDATRAARRAASFRNKRAVGEFTTGLIAIKADDRVAVFVGYKQTGDLIAYLKTLERSRTRLDGTGLPHETGCALN